MNTNWYIFNCVNKLNVYGPHFMVKIYWTASQNVILYKLFCDRVVINWVFHRDWKIKASWMHHQRDDWKVWVNIAVHKNCSALGIMCTSGLHQSNVICVRTASYSTKTRPNETVLNISLLIIFRVYLWLVRVHEEAELHPDDVET